jgi:hypothetical protein
MEKLPFLTYVDLLYSRECDLVVEVNDNTYCINFLKENEYFVNCEETSPDFYINKHDLIDFLEREENVKCVFFHDIETELVLYKK